jgi:hypothetical protein
LANSLALNMESEVSVTFHQTTKQITFFFLWFIWQHVYLKLFNVGWQDEQRIINSKNLEAVCHGLIYVLCWHCLTWL